MTKIVLVEDDKMLAEIYQTRLQLANYDCLVANDGASGLSLIKQELPDLVLLDLMLPMLSGDDVLREMRKNDWGKNTKVLVLTNISESEAPDDLRELSIEGYIVKANLVHNQLAETVDKILGRHNAPAPS